MEFDDDIRVITYLNDIINNKHYDNLMNFCPVCVIEYNYSLKE